jgi:hypothetical protein
MSIIERKLEKEAWIILERTPDQGVQPTWYKTDKDKSSIPVVFDEERRAQKAMLEDFRDDVNERIEDFICGDREFDEVVLECSYWVEPCTVLEDGTVILEDGSTFGPRK